MSVKPKYWTRIIRAVVFTAAVVWFQSSGLSTSNASPLPTFSSSNSSSESGSWFEYLGYVPKGEYLVISYKVQYPGMVKVKMFDSEGQLLWRSQYVNNKEGKYSVILRAKYLNPGSLYVFEFDYKNTKKEFPITL